MAVNGTAQERTGNLIPEGKEISFETVARSAARPEAVYDVLADVRSHLEWGGTKSKKRYRLTSIDVGEAPAVRGSEFSSTGVAPDGSFSDRSVVTEAIRPGAFEFVTEAQLTPKKGPTAQWTLVHRYEITPDGTGSRIRFVSRVTRATGLPGPNKLLLKPVIGPLLMKMTAGMAKPGLKNLAAMAEEGQPRR